MGLSTGHHTVHSHHTVHTVHSHHTVHRHHTVHSPPNPAWRKATTQCRKVKLNSFQVGLLNCTVCTGQDSRDYLDLPKCPHIVTFINTTLDNRGFYLISGKLSHTNSIPCFTGKMFNVSLEQNHIYIGQLKVINQRRTYGWSKFSDRPEQWPGLS